MAMTNRSRIYNYSSTYENTESSFLTMAAALAAISSHLPSSMASSMLSISRILLLVSGKAIGEYNDLDVRTTTPSSIAPPLELKMLPSFSNPGSSG
eukprot:CAMPEP_0196188810 /NCGR_PEP_ID=MMETSP0911-20130528/43046_1 /TAXON_ID=49265 /ORGANISM="Thalassiosira rotula, Strain GSO102" /LENGTH=95 /DNA_ID=CAMNT_0041460263 /DNA_START=31 /DNA_END=315 /DNA_ORIENTATION=+